MAAVGVRLLEASLAARDRPESLRGVLRSLLNGLSEALRTGARIQSFGCTAGRLRWGKKSVAPHARWRLPASFWKMGDGAWRVRLGSGGLEKEIAAGWISGQNSG